MESERLLETPARRYYPALDGLRAVAVLLVFGAHSVGDLVPGGFIGVDIFFVLSGFLITTLLAAEWSRTGSVLLGAFYARRALRLYPALVIALLLAAALTPTIGRGWWHFICDSMTSLTYTFNLYILFPTNDLSPVGHFWSLCVEEQYYLVWPLVLVWLLRRRGASAAIKWTFVSMFAATAIKAVLVPVLGSGRLYFLPLGHADELLVGSLVGLLLVFRPKVVLKSIVSSWPVPWFCSAGLLVVALTQDAIQDHWLYFGGLFIIATAAALIVLHVVVSPRSAMSRALALQPMKWLGRRSYAFYLYHQPIIWLYRELGLAYRFVVPLALVSTLVLVAISWPLEQRLLRSSRSSRASSQSMAVVP